MIHRFALRSGELNTWRRDVPRPQQFYVFSNHRWYKTRRRKISLTSRTFCLEHKFVVNRSDNVSYNSKERSNYLYPLRVFHHWIFLWRGSKRYNYFRLINDLAVKNYDRADSSPTELKKWLCLCQLISIHPRNKNRCCFINHEMYVGTKRLLNRWTSLV